MYKRSTQLVPFSLLDEKTKQTGRDAMRDALGTLLGFGYTVEPLEQEHGGKFILFQEYSLENCHLDI